MSTYDINYRDLAEKAWGRMVAMITTDEIVPPWTEVDDDEKDEFIAVVTLVAQVAKDNLMAQVMAELVSKIQEIVDQHHPQQLGPEESKPADESLDDPAAGMPGLRPVEDVQLPATDPWMER